METIRPSRPTTPVGVGKVVTTRGLPKLFPTHAVQSDSFFDIFVQDPSETGGVFKGKLKRGRKVRLTARKPAVKGIALMAAGGATSVPLYMYMEPGIYLPPDNGSVSLVLAPGRMNGDDLRVRCEGGLPSGLNVWVLHRAQSGSEMAASYRLRSGGGAVNFVISTAGLTSGIVLATLATDKGQARIDRCIVKRVAP